MHPALAGTSLAAAPHVGKITKPHSNRWTAKMMKTLVRDVLCLMGRKGITTPEIPDWFTIPYYLKDNGIVFTEMQGDVFYVGFENAWCIECYAANCFDKCTMRVWRIGKAPKVWEFDLDLLVRIGASEDFPKGHASESVVRDAVIHFRDAQSKYIALQKALSLATECSCNVVVAYDGANPIDTIMDDLGKEFNPRDLCCVTKNSLTLWVENRRSSTIQFLRVNSKELPMVDVNKCALIFYSVYNTAAKRLLFERYTVRRSELGLPPLHHGNFEGLVECP